MCILKLELCYIYCYRKKEKKEQIGKMKKRAKIFARIHITIYVIFIIKKYICLITKLTNLNN